MLGSPSFISVYTENKFRNNCLMVTSLDPAFPKKGLIFSHSVYWVLHAIVVGSQFLLQIISQSLACFSVKITRDKISYHQTGNIT